MDALGCDALVTGHHARVEGEPGRRRLLRGVDAAKDQSYVLHMLRSPQLDQIELPIGRLTKAGVRRHAARLGLRTADKADSQDLCFVAGDYRDIIRARFPGADRPGTIVDTDGVVLGEHAGTTRFTVGQRKGLGIALGEPRFVVRIEAESGTVVVGRRSDLLATGCVLEDVTWTAGAPPADMGGLAVQIRYRAGAVPARLVGEAGSWTVWFDEPQEAVSPGQAGVVYRSDEVLGGGTITEARTEVPA